MVQNVALWCNIKKNDLSYTYWYILFDKKFNIIVLSNLLVVWYLGSKVSYNFNFDWIWYMSLFIRNFYTVILFEFVVYLKDDNLSYYKNYNFLFYFKKLTYCH